MLEPGRETVGSDPDAIFARVFNESLIILRHVVSRAMHRRVIHLAFGQISKGDTTVTISKIYTAVANVFTNKRGAAMVEYALLAGLIAVVAMATLSTLGTNVKSQFNSIATAL